MIKNYNNPIFLLKELYSSFRMLQKARENKDVLIVSFEERKFRLKQCKECEHLSRFKVRCKRCGCFVNMKSHLKFENCLENKWNN